jgi:hypothetical protein
MTRTQNEGVVQWLLEVEPAATLVPIPGFSDVLPSPVTAGDVEPRGGGAEHEVAAVPWRSGALTHTVRFDPATSKTSGLFVAKISKRTGSLYFFIRRVSTRHMLTPRGIAPTQ